MSIYALRVLSAVLTLIYTFAALSSCAAPLVTDQAATNEQQIPLGQSSSSEVVINILHPHSDKSLELQQAAALFLQDHPNAQIQMRSVDGDAEYTTALRARLLSGEQIDIFHIYSHQDLLELEGYIADLSELEWVQSAIPETLAAVTKENRLYGIPYALEGVGLIANRRIFDSANLSLSPTANFEELSETFLELRQQIDAGELSDDFPDLRHVTEFPALDKPFLTQQLLDIAFTTTFNLPEQAALAPIAAPAHQDALEAYIKLMARYSSSRADWEGLNSVSLFQQLENGLLAERVAIIQQNTNIWTRIEKLAPELGEDLLLLPVPLEGVEQSGVYIGAPSYWVIHKDASPESAALAQEFLTWLYQSEEGAAFLAEDFRILSPYHDVSKPTGIPLQDQLLKYIEQGRTHTMVHAEVPAGWEWEVFGSGLRDYFASDDLDWQRFIGECTTEWARRRRENR